MSDRKIFYYERAKKMILVNNVLKFIALNKQLTYYKSDSLIE